MPDNFLAPDMKPHRVEDMENSLKSFMANRDIHSKDVNPKEDAMHKMKQMLFDKIHDRTKKPDNAPAFDAANLRVGLSDEICVNFDAPVCSVIDDMCSIVSTANPKADVRWCTEASSFCKLADNSYPELNSAINNKMCTQFKASVPACSAAHKICSSSKSLESGAFCSRVGQLCSK